MARIEKSLKEWVEKGLLSEEQSRRIIAFEEAKPESSWILSGLLLLGAAIVGIGVVSLIAANWALIPPTLKLITNFAWLVGTAYAAHRAWSASRPLAFEALLLFFMLLCLASIGLISQIYNTGGRLDQALLFWSLITAGCMTAARRSFTPFVWASALYGGLAGFAMMSHSRPIFGEYVPIVFSGLFAAFAFLTLICVHVAGPDTALSRAMKGAVLCAGLGSLLVTETFHGAVSRDARSEMFLFCYGLGALAVVMLAWNRVYRRFQKITLAAALSLVIVMSNFGVWNIRVPLAYAVTTIAILFLTALFLASEGRRRWFQFFLLVLGFRFLSLYFEALGGLATTGVGLIVSGGLVLGMAWGWNKYRRRLMEWAERWSS